MTALSAAASAHSANAGPVLPALGAVVRPDLASRTRRLRLTALSAVASALSEETGPVLPALVAVVLHDLAGRTLVCSLHLRSQQGQRAYAEHALLMHRCACLACAVCDLVVVGEGGVG